MNFFTLLLLALATIASAVSAATETSTQPGKIETGDATKPIRYRQFGLEVTEYCSGTTPNARVCWTDTDNSDGKNINFDDGKMFTEINLGYNIALRVGPYDFETHNVGLHYGACDWDQYVEGVGECGFCDPDAWSSNNLNCAAIAGDRRVRVFDLAEKKALMKNRRATSTAGSA
jgi:hypothetical protein